MMQDGMFSSVWVLEMTELRREGHGEGSRNRQGRLLGRF